MPRDENVSLFDNPILFRAWDIDWTVIKICLATCLFLWLVAGLCGWILARHTEGAKWQKMSSAEAADLAVNAGRAPHERFGQVYAGKAVGVSGEISIGIDGLRQAARRGDWLTFWLWPILFTCAFAGAWFLGVGITLEMPWFSILVTIFCLAPIGMVWFAAWAAIYTNIDAGTAPNIPGEEARPGR